MKLVSLTEKLCSQQTAYISHFGVGFFKRSSRKATVYGAVFGKCTAVATARLCGVCQVAEPASASLRTAVASIWTGTSTYAVRDCLGQKSQGTIYFWRGQWHVTQATNDKLPTQ